MLLTYLIRYRLMGHIGHFCASAELGAIFRRGQAVVIRSTRGVEPGEVLTACDDPDRRDSKSKIAPPERNDSSLVHCDTGRVYRLVRSEDLARAQERHESRLNRFSMCQRILDEDGRKWELLDIEPLLDGETIVLHYLGPHELDAVTLRARFRVACNLDEVLEPVGIDGPRDQSGAVDGQHECSRCDRPSEHSSRTCRRRV